MYTINSLDQVVSFMGAVVGCPMALIVPPWIQLHLDHHHTTLSLSRTQRVMHWIVIGCGIGIMTSSIIIITHHHHHHSSSSSIGFFKFSIH
jgi:hypothetical protein